MKKKWHIYEQLNYEHKSHFFGPKHVSSVFLMPWFWFDVCIIWFAVCTSCSFGFWLLWFCALCLSGLLFGFAPCVWLVCSLTAVSASRIFSTGCRGPIWQRGFNVCVSVSILYLCLFMLVTFTIFSFIVSIDTLSMNPRIISVFIHFLWVSLCVDVQMQILKHMFMCSFCGLFLQIYCQES